MIGDFVITDILGLVIFLLALGYVVANRRILPGGGRNLFLLSFLALGGEIVAANAEQVLLPRFFNLAEHLLRVAVAVLLALACWNLAAGEDEA
jgi:hypothetical protein